MNLIFEPEKVKQLACPFSIFISVGSGKDRKLQIIPFETTNLSLVAGLNKPLIMSMSAMTSKAINAEKKTYQNHHKKLNLKKDVNEYVEKHLSDYYYKNFQKIFQVLGNNKNLYHKIEIGEKRYKNSACSFRFSISPKLSFKLNRKGKKIGVDTIYNIGNKEFESDSIKRYGFLIALDNQYYLLKKSEWELLDFLEKVGTFSFKDFSEKYKDKFRNYSLDYNGVFKEESRKIVPDVLIQVSELQGGLLLFTPKWSYDGHITDDREDSFSVIEDDRIITYIRDKEVEQKTLDFLRDAHPKFKDKKSFYLTFSEASKKNWFFHFYHDELKDNFTVTGMDMLGYFRYSDHKIETEFRIIKTLDNILVAKFKAQFGKETVSAKALQKALINGERFVLLKDNSLGILSEEWINEFGIILKNASVDGDEIEFAKWLMIVSEFRNSSVDRVIPENWMEKWKQWNQSETALYPVPKSVKVDLRAYQQKGYDWINLMAEVNAGTLLADDMGLGKTIQTICSLAYWLEEKPDSKFLIVCPASLIYNWKDEFEKFAPNIPISVHHGADRDIYQFLKSDNAVLITSYSLMRNDIDSLSAMIWDALILDESHHIKNYSAKQTQAALRLNGKRRIILNGTPIMNNLEDLYPQLSFLLPQLFYSPKRFRDQFIKPLTNKEQLNPMEALRKLTQPFILRRTKETAAPDLPHKTETVLWCEMEPDQRTAYEEVKKQVKENILVQVEGKGLNKAKLGVLQGITKLRQACSSPKILKEFPDYEHVSSVKINNLIETLQSDLANNKALVFTQFLGTMDILKEKFEEHGITYRSFSGSTKIDERIRLVSEFQEEESDIQVFLLSLMAGNSGINLTQANYVFLMEPWWNKAVQQQAIDRTHRIGQGQKVFAYNMICRNSIEEKILALQKQKQILSDEVIVDDANFLKNLTEEDIAFLFE